MSARQALRITGAAAYHLLKLTHESSDVLPPLKSVAGGALYITDLVKKFRTSKKEWQEFGTYVQDIVATIVDSLGIVHAHQTETIEKLEKLKAKLNEITETIESKQREGLWARGLHFLGHPDMIAELKQKVDGAVNHLQFDLVMKAEIKIDKALKNDIRSKLRYVEGASWDPDRVCLENTRNHIIEEILSWVDNATDSRTENILLLTGVAGAGKSTIAHTIAQYYYSRKQLVTSFFFDRETNERNNPKHLIGTIATDFCRTNGHLANRIMRVIEEDEGVASAPISRQFDELVLKPCSDFAAENPLVIVLDALDEGYDAHLLRILAQGVSQLPHRICFVVTSRILPQVDVLRHQHHVRELELDIHSTNSIDDVALFVSHRLKMVAEYHRLGDQWPNPKLVASFTTRAEGLFLWVATTCDYLLTRSDPTTELQKLVSASHTVSMSAEPKMDKLYTTILQACNWDDEAFANDYHRLMGAAVATKTPLTLGALGMLHQHEPLVSNLACGQLSPLLTGLGSGENGRRPVRFLHQSFRDFLTLRVLGLNSPPENHRLGVDEMAHSQTLALLCLNQMNRELNRSIPGLGYLARDDLESPGIPNAPENGILEALWYACRFWVDHLVDIEPPLSPSVQEQLEEFLGSRLTLWMESLAMNGRYEGLSKLHNWVKGQQVEQTSFIALIFNASQGASLISLASRLDYMGRLEEALTAASERVEVYRKLAENGTSGSQADLARSLRFLSYHLHKLGRQEDGLGASEEALKLLRELASEDPAAFKADLASAIHNFSSDLHNLGRHKEALEAIEEAVKLRRQLASERPAAFTSDLASSVHQLSVCLYSFGHHDEALEATEEEVKLYRQLASERPAAFIPSLAASVHSLSVDFASVGRHEEALEAIEEAVKLQRQLASERPAAFTSALANSVHSLSIDLASFGRHEEALEAIEEAVKLRRQLASERPAAFTSDLASSVHALSVCLYNLSRHEEALEAIEEAVKRRRQLANERPAAFTSDLAYSVHELSVDLHSLGRHDEALKASEEAVKLGRRLASERPAAFTPDLAESLHDLAVGYKTSGFHQKALETIKESVELYRPFAEKYPAKYGAYYSTFLQRLDQYSSEAETQTGALESPRPDATTPVEQ